MKSIAVFLIIMMTSLFSYAEENLDGYCEAEMINNTLSYLIGRGVVQPGAVTNESLPSDTLAHQKNFYTDENGFTVIPYEVTWKGNSGLMPDNFVLNMQFKLDAEKCNLVTFETVQN